MSRYHIKGHPSVLLIHPDAFHLGWMGATQRLFHIAKAFNEIKFKVVLLSGRCTNPELQKILDDEFPGIVIRSGHSGDYPFFIDFSKTFRRGIRVFWKLSGQDSYWTKLSWGWAKRLNLNWVHKEVHIRQLTPSLIWGVSAGYLDGAVAARQIADSYGLPWIFELHDPPRRAGLGPDNKEVQRKFSGLLNDAARVVVTAESYKQSLVQNYSLNPGKLHTIHLSYDGEPCQSANISAQKQGFFNLVYAGSLSGGRTVKPLLKAISDAFDQHPAMRGDFKLEMAGAGPGFEEGLSLARDLGIEKNLVLHGLVDVESVNRLLERSVVLVVQENTSALQIPGKVFEALKTGKAILGMMPNDCEAAAILKQSGLGWICETNDIDGLRDTIIRIWKRWRNKEALTTPNETVILSFSTDRLPQKLSCALEGVAGVPNCENRDEEKAH